MAADKLNNYNKSMLEMMADIPQGVMGRVAADASEIIAKYLSPTEIKRFLSTKTSTFQKMQDANLAMLQQHGFKSLEFINQQMEWNVSFMALSLIKTEEVALKVCRQIVEATYPPMFAAMLPTSESLKRCIHPFEAFSDWFLMYMKANQQERLFDFKIVQKDHTLFHFNCSWCAWHEIHHQLGNPKACESICYADLAFFPNYCKRINVDFYRSKALGWGDSYCEFKFLQAG